MLVVALQKARRHYTPFGLAEASQELGRNRTRLKKVVNTTPVRMQGGQDAKGKATGPVLK